MKINMTLTIFQKLGKDLYHSVSCFTWNNKSSNLKVNFYINWKFKSFKGSKYLYESKHILNNICIILFNIINAHKVKSSEDGLWWWLYNNVNVLNASEMVKTVNFVTYVLPQ